MEDVIRTRIKLILDSVQVHINSAQCALKRLTESNFDFKELELIGAKLKGANERFVSEIHNYCKSVSQPSVDEISQYTSIQIQAEELVSEIDISIKQNERRRCTGSSNGENINITSKLPRMELAKFDGDVLKWYQFWDQFTSNVDCRNISEVDKLLYLQSVLEGEAKQAIVGLDTTNKNYGIAVNTLKERYGKPSAIIDAHYVALYRIKSAATNNVKDNRQGSTAWLSLLLAVLAYVTPASSSSPRVVCYYTNWSVYRPGTAKFNPQNINPYLCTHLVYAFGGFTKENSLKPFDKYQDIEKGGYAKFNGLKTYNKQLKTLLAVGGWNEGSARFSPMVAARDRRKEFVKSAIKFLRQNQFDGLDLDWEYPAFRDGGKPKDRENYAKLVKELREEFERESEKTGKPRLLLTMAVPAGIEYIQKGFDVATLNRYLDWMNLLTYDYHSAFEPAVNHHAPLYPLEEPNEYSVDNELNIDYTIKFYLENGADRDKLVLGIPTYGRSYTLFNPDAVDIGSPADGPGEQGDATREKGYLAYYEICEALKPKQKKRSIDSEEEEDEEDSEEEVEEEWTVMHPNPSAMGPVAFRGNQWVGYDDIDIVKKKAEYVAENGLGGIMFWSIDNDDFRGTCHNKPYPLIEAAKEAYIVKLGATDNSIVTEKPKSRSSSGGRRRSKPRSSTSTTTTPKPTTTAKSSKRKSSTSLSTTPSWNIVTPAPPTTPDPGSDFKCTDEGFFPHPRDCKKYFWCLDSGPSNLGIVAHQFTCPSGLFFNKAADSCDFARNVLCKVKEPTTTKAPKTTRVMTSKATEATTTTTTTTTRRPVRLTSRSSLLFRTTSTTPVPEVVEESEEEEEEETVPEDTSDVDAEDPRVIKELIDLIKKVGGVEQLEKQLRLSESGGSTSGVTAATTPTPFNKRLYQKVLERTRGSNRFANSVNSVNSIEGIPQNSRRSPQNAGLDPGAPATDRDKLLRKDRPQYTTINRSRPSTTTQEPEESEELEEESAEVPLSRARAVGASTARPLQYVNIRRARPTTVADADDASRNAVYERSAVSDTANSLDIASARRESIPEYVTIRRSRPTTEETTTVQYQNPEREEESQETALEREISSPSSQPQYTSIIRTRSTTLPPPEELSSPEPTTVLSVQISSLLNSPNSAEVESPAPETTAAPTEPEPTTVSSTTTSTTTTTASPTTAASSSLPTRRNLLRRRGSTTTTTTTAPVSSTQAAKERRPFLRRTKATAPPDAAESETSTDNVETTTNKYTKRGNSKFKSPKDAEKDSAAEKTRETGENETRTRQPSLNGSAARSDRPTRNFVRRRLGGANSSSTSRSTSILAASAATRRPFRVASRRRPVSTSQASAAPSETTTQSTTQSTTLSTTLSTTTTTQSTIDLESEELQDVVDIGDIDSIEDPTLTTGVPRSNGKATRRPLVSLKVEEDQNPSATNEDERKRQSKKYSATFKQNQLDQALRARSREEDAETTTEGKTTLEDISAETAVALAAHQLLTAPVPIIPDYDDVKPTKKTPKTTLDYKYANTYTDDYKQTYTEQYSTPTYQEYGQTTAYTGTNTNPVTDIFARVSRPGYNLNPTISGPNVGVDASTARYTVPETNAPTTYEYTTRSRPGYSANLISPTASGVTINVGEDLSTRFTGTDREIPSTFPTLFTSRVSRPSGFTAPVTTPTSFRERSTRYQVSDRLPTTRYQEPIPVPVDFGYSTDGYSPSQEPSYFTREYLLESPVTKAYDDEYQYLSPITSPQTTPTTTATKPPKKKVVFRKISTTQRPTTPNIPETTTTLKPRRVATRKPFEKVQKTRVKDENRTYRPIANYDYYDEGDEKMAGKYDEGAKVILHGKDSIECLDIGNFPHPTSCKKFISCARIDNGSLLGWEYVCPKGLSFDPVGGICNWAAGLGCGEKDI